MIIKLNFIILLGLSFGLVYGEHLRDHEYVFHPFNWYNYDIYDYQMITVFIPSEDTKECFKGYAITNKGACTLTKYHFDIWPLRLLTVMPDWCPYEYCVNDLGIWMKAGAQKEYLWNAIQEADNWGRVALAT